MSDITDIPVAVAKCRTPKGMGMLILEIGAYAAMLFLTYLLH